MRMIDGLTGELLASKDVTIARGKGAFLDYTDPALPAGGRRCIIAAIGVPLLTVGAVRAFAPKGEMVTWEGEALGAWSSLSLWHHDKAFARRTVASMIASRRVRPCCTSVSI